MADQHRESESVVTKRGGLGLVLQFAAFGLGIAMLVWAGLRASGQMERVGADGLTGWEHLRRASFGEIGLLVALSLGTVLLNGLMWWLAYRPVGRLPIWTTVCVNAIGHALSFLPAKVSVLFRVIYHKRIDGVPVMRFGGWAVTLAAVLFAALGPAVVAALALPEAGGAAWWVAAVLGALACGSLGVVLARFFSTGAGWRALERVIRKLPAGSRVVDSGPFRNAHDGVFMCTSFAAVLSGTGLRLLDGLNAGARFYVTSRVLGVDLGIGDAMVLGVVYFLLGVLAPTGPLGARELVSGQLAVLLGSETVDHVSLFVTAVEMPVVIACAAAAGLALQSRIRRALSPASGGEEANDSS